MQLLHKDVNHRLGCRDESCAADVKAHEFFNNINFRRLESRKSPFGIPPYDKVPFELDVSVWLLASFTVRCRRLIGARALS